MPLSRLAYVLRVAQCSHMPEAARQPEACPVMLCSPVTCAGLVTSTHSFHSCRRLAALLLLLTRWWSKHFHDLLGKQSSPI